MTWKNSVNMPNVALAVQDPASFVKEITISAALRKSLKGWVL